MPKSTDDLLKDAVAGTENEIFASAMEQDEPDDSGDRSLESMGDGLEGNDTDPPEPAEGEDGEPEEVEAAEGDGEAEEDDEAAGEQPEAKALPAEAQPELKGLPPAARAALLAERKNRQTAEAALETLRAEARQQAAEMNARLDRALSAMQPAKPKAEEPEEADPFVDPRGFKSAILSEAERNYTTRRVQETFADAHEEHKQDFETAFAELQRLNPNNPADKALGQRIYTAPNPGKELMRWHKQQVAIREVGPDPAAYRQRVRDELLKDPETRKALVAQMREEAGQGGGKPRTGVRLPPSLNSAGGGSSARVADPSIAGDNSDRSVFDYAMRG